MALNGTNKSKLRQVSDTLQYLGGQKHGFKENSIGVDLSADKLVEDLKKIISYYKLLEQNDGCAFWDKTINILVLSAEKALKGKESTAMWAALYVIYSEARKLSSFNSTLGRSLSSLEVMLSNKDSSPMTRGEVIYKSYITRGRFEIEVFQKDGQLNKRISDVVSSNFKKLEEKEAVLEKRLEDTEKTLSAAQGETSFVTAYKGLSKYSTKLANKLRIIKILRYALMGAILSILAWNFFELSLFSDDEKELAETVSVYRAPVGNVYQEASNDVYDSIRHGITVTDIKLGIIKISLILVLVYFLRIVIREERDVESLVQDIEYKAAITSFQRDHLEVVKESEGDINASIARYEEFIYMFADQKDRHDNPEVTDGVTKIVESVEKVVKATKK